LRKIEGEVPDYLRMLIKNPSLFLRKTHLIPFGLQDNLYDPPFMVDQFNELTDLVVEKLEKIPNLARLGDRFKDTLIIGDTHGFIDSMRRIIRPFLEEKVDSLIFLGDYVDRGESGFVNFALVLALKCAWPDNVIILRGNHEDIAMNQSYGLQQELLSYYNYEKYKQIAESIDIIYNYLSLAAITPQRSIAFHGGIPQEMERIDDLEIIPKPHGKIAAISDETERKKAYNYFEQLRWNDPRENQEEEFAESFRGFYFFNKQVVERFLEKSGAKRIIRSHESRRGGFMSLFEGKVLHVFSAEPYGGIISMAFVIHEQKNGTTMLRDLDFNPIQKI